MEDIETPMNEGNLVQRVLPYSTAVLVLGIISIPTCLCYGIVGIVTGIIGIVLGNKAKNLYLSNPKAYTESSYKNANAGLICAIIGTCLSGLILLSSLITLLFVSTAFSSLFGFLPWLSNFH
jgi:hypothetical protein